MFLHRAAIIKQLRQCNEQSHVFTDVPSSPVPEVSTFSQIQEAVSLPAHQTGKERLTLRLLVELFFFSGQKDVEVLDHRVKPGCVLPGFFLHSWKLQAVNPWMSCTMLWLRWWALRRPWSATRATCWYRTQKTPSVTVTFISNYLFCAIKISRSDFRSESPGPTFASCCLQES